MCERQFCTLSYIITTVLRLPTWPLPGSSERPVIAVVRQMPREPLREQDQVIITMTVIMMQRLCCVAILIVLRCVNDCAVLRCGRRNNAIIPTSEHVHLIKSHLDSYFYPVFVF